ncbi:MAG: hypothetical protein KDC61_12395 [Saprospiraceae bacterium]|nr:hypothetical protein [Saprospiraceae bacterium]MCB0543529.1 hypothetical protein [Saprospiraceae bacterium]MCB0575351.1 hypothetical protein [Saprospiraceae bacterium]MCB9305863.1 hypothetical protein [Lewinellaceae bacterium]MCB9355766.1 hypothetical protein [Lewinellaceae bacterium]
MGTKDFTVFRTLIADVYTKAFGEPLAKLPHGKAQTLSWMIHEITGELLSHKSLSNYIHAILKGDPGRINPTDATLSILARFVSGEKETGGRHEMRMGIYAPWYKYRVRVLAGNLAA